MEIIIGGVPPLSQHYPAKQPDQETGYIPAKLLHVRPPRKGVAGPSGMERRNKKTKDPRKAKILTIMVPDGDRLPKDLGSGEYTVMLRFQR